MALARQPSPSNNGKNGSALPGSSSTSEAVTRQSALQRGALEQYQRAQVESASPTRLIVLLYEGAIRFCRIAQQAMRNRDLETQNTNLIRAQRIVGELLASLNRGAGGEVASNLSNIYAHILEELVEANLYDKSEKLDHVLSLLSEMRESWVEIDRLASSNVPLLDAPADNTNAVEASPKTVRVAPPQTPPPSRPVRPNAGVARLLAAQNSAAGSATPSRLGDRLA